MYAVYPNTDGDLEVLKLNPNTLEAVGSSFKTSKPKSEMKQSFYIHKLDSWETLSISYIV